MNHNTGRLSALQQVGGGPGHGFFESTQKQAKHVARLKTILTLLNAATHAGQLNAPGLRLHPLKGKPAGRCAVWVDENFRVIVRFEATYAAEVDS